MQLRLRGKKIAVEKVKQPHNAATHLIMPERDEYTGIVRFVGEEAAKDIKVGDKVYFNTKFHKSHIDGKELCIILDEDILAVVVDEKANT